MSEPRFSGALTNDFVGCDRPHVHTITVKREAMGNGHFSYTMGICPYHPDECGTVIDWSKVCAERAPCLIHESLFRKALRLSKALEAVANWDLPSQTYEWDYGSEGAKRYIRGVARAALAPFGVESDEPNV